MNGYQLIMRIQQKMQQDPSFANRVNRAVAELKSMPGLQQQVLQIAQMSNEKQRQQAIDRLPIQARQAVQDILEMLN